MLVQRRAIITVPGEIGREHSQRPPKRVQEIVNPVLRELLLKTAQRFLEVKAAEGETYYAPDDMHVYGPFPTLERLQVMISNEELGALGKDHPAFVIETAEEKGAFANYLLVANFTKKEDAQPTLLLAR